MVFPIRNRLYAEFRVRFRRCLYGGAKYGVMSREVIRNARKSIVVASRTSVNVRTQPSVKETVCRVQRRLILLYMIDTYACNLRTENMSAFTNATFICKRSHEYKVTKLTRRS